MLEAELEFFNENRSAWLDKHQNRVALVKGRELVGMFDSEEQAIAEGARQFGLTPFLVKRVTPKDAEFTAPALSLGILCGNPPCSTLGNGSGS